MFSGFSHKGNIVVDDIDELKSSLRSFKFTLELKKHSNDFQQIDDRVERLDTTQDNKICCEV